jgi:sigma-B regulation protein RsbU (phosphoserine phosphatase)
LFVTPMIVKETAIGFVGVDPGNHDLTPDQIRLLQTIGNQIAAALENARLYAVAIEKAKMEHEFQLARELQSSLIPRELPQIPGWDVAAIWKPARIVSGDFYDFIPIHHAASSSSQGLVIADVSDKGAPAALFMALVRSVLRTIVSSMPSPVESITRANRLICDDAASGMFVTLFYAQIDPIAGELVYVNAGHNPPLLYRQGQEHPIELERTGIALGVQTERQFAQRTVTLAPGDFILFYTDGVTDATNVQEQTFGEARLRRVMLEQRGASAAQIIAALDQALGEFAAGEPSFDDITILVLRRL